MKKGRIEERQEQAIERQQEYDKLSTLQKLDKVTGRLSDDGASDKELSRLMKQIIKEGKQNGKRI